MAHKILLIDDDLTLRELYNDVFISQGYEVDTAKDGKEGLDKIIANPYDIILLDVMLPQIDGLGILTKLKQSPPKTKLPPVILLTNLAHDQAVKDAMSLGAHTVLIKANITPSQLVAKVKEILGEKVAAAPASTPETPPAKAA